jgi:SAM-dependent methyltransferase
MATFRQPATAKHLPKTPSAVEQAPRLRCPSCGHFLDGAALLDDTSSTVCAACGYLLTSRQGIWEAVLPQRLAMYQRFIEEYETVRRLEGRGSDGGHYYLALPFKDMTGCNSWQWRIRGRSFRFFAQKILPILECQVPVGLDVLDIGAGNCWLSYRLALRGHRPVAVDLLVNQHDGLGAARHYFCFLPRRFPRFRADMDHMPFAARQFDLAVFNASFHYSEDYGRTLEECVRCLRRPGHIFIIDSPLYHSQQSGEAMVRERRAVFEKRYGFRSDSIPGREYLTPSILSDLALRHGITWTILEPWYGLTWAIRPLRAWLMRRREPAKFRILWGTVE